MPATRQRTARAVACALVGLLTVGCSGPPTGRASAPPPRTVPGGSSMPPADLGARLRITTATHDGQPVWTLAPRGSGTGQVVLFLHGGAFSGPLGELHWRYAAWLVERTAATVVVPDYPRLPAATVTTTLPFTQRLLERLVAAHPGRVTVMGDSSGGGLALSTVQEMARRHRTLPARVILHSPWLDATLSDPGIPLAQAKDPFLTAQALRPNGTKYAGGLDPRDPRVSPVYGPVRGLPPVSVYIGDHDLLVVDARRLRDRAAAEGAPIDYHEYPGQAHDFMLAEQRTQSQQVMELVARSMGAQPG